MAMDTTQTAPVVAVLRKLPQSPASLVGAAVVETVTATVIDVAK